MVYYMDTLTTEAAIQKQYENVLLKSKKMIDKFCYWLNKICASMLYYITKTKSRRNRNVDKLPFKRTSICPPVTFICTKHYIYCTLLKIQLRSRVLSATSESIWRSQNTWYVRVKVGYIQKQVFSIIVANSSNDEEKHSILKKLSHGNMENHSWYTEFW